MLSMAERDSGATALELIKGLMQSRCELSVYAPSLAFPLAATVRDLREEQGLLVLNVYSRGHNLLDGTSDSFITLDVERLDGPRHEFESLSLEYVKAEISRVRDSIWEIRCFLRDARVIVADRRGGIRIPFIQDMTAKVAIDLQDEYRITSPVIRNLSQGGCLLELPIEDSYALSIGQEVTGVNIQFPNGDEFSSKAAIRHMRPFGRSRHVRIGFEFIDMASSSRSRLQQLVSDCEGEVARRLGLHNAKPGASRLFQSRAGEPGLEALERNRGRQLPPMVKGLREVARNLHLVAYHIKGRQHFPDEMLNDCAETVLHMVRENRAHFLYALSHLLNEAQWVRHSIRLAGYLADALMKNRAYAGKGHDAVLGCLLHNAGKPLVLGTDVPSMNIILNTQQRALMKNHVSLLLDYLEEIQYPLPPLAMDIIANGNERLDGSGYPAGKSAPELSPAVRIVSIIKAVDTLTGPRNERGAMTPIEAYRWIYARPEQYDRTLLIHYIKRFGFYPIGSLARFSGGFLAWIMELDEKGAPAVVRVVKNMAFPDTELDTVLTAMDFDQIGKLESIVCPFAQGMVHENK